MRSKLLILLLSIYVIHFYPAQSTFPYERAWGTYVGGNNSNLVENSLVGNTFFSDNQNNIYVNGATVFQNGYTASYYNQYVNGGGNTVNMSSTQNQYFAKFSSNGQMLIGSYGNINNSYERMVGIDALNNKFTCKKFSGQISNLATPGVWLTQNTNTSSTHTIILTKYDANNNVIWATYLPNTNDSDAISLRIDANQNIYVLGSTNADIPGLSTSGVLQENFIAYLQGNQQKNSYLVKLNSSGQKIWGTFSAPSIIDFELYNNELYLAASYSTAMPANYTDVGTFQPSSPAENILLKLNANTGQKVWGTFYGTPHNPALFTGFGITSIEVNSTGVYVIGQNQNDSFPTYFATAGAFKSQLSGGADLFLSKFDFTGNRTWSTYFGSNGYEDILGANNLTVLGNRIIFTGTQYGSVNNISTTGAFLTTIPNSSPSLTNMFFTEFDTNGNRIWTSYYGGAGSNSMGEYINCKLLNDGSVVLWGHTGSPTGIGTEGAPFQFMINPYPQAPFGFIAKFNLKNPLATTDLEKQNDIQLYNNPNNGNFYITGSVLEKQKVSLKIFEISGRLIYNLSLDKKKTHHIELQNQLSKGNYLIEINSEKGENLKVFKMTVK